MSSSTPSPIESLYAHVPFCAQKCSYCAFYSEAANGEVVNRYVEAFIRELEMVAQDLAPKTIFFGGGTPSLLNLSQWEKILETMRRLHLTEASEWTVECNPATVSLDKARLLKAAGVNRISMGVQSLDESLLDRLGRIHSREMVFKSFDILRAAGFDNINIDLMFAIPSQTREVWHSTLSEATAMGSEHLSSYEVIYEDDTPLYAQLKAGEFDVDEDLACLMYEDLVEKAGDAGFHQYEIANFALDLGATPPLSGTASEGMPLIPSQACKHNVNYWRGGSFYGLGPSATGYVRGVRTKNWSNTQMYCDQIEKGVRAIESKEELTPRNRAGEIAAFGLRMNAGWPFEQFKNVTGWEFEREWAGAMESLVRNGWGKIHPQGFHLTPEGLRFADAAAEMVIGS